MTSFYQCQAKDKVESIQAHPYLNVCAQCKHGLGISDDISKLTIGGRQECWQKQPGEIEEINREADSKKPFETVNELRGEKHKDNASPAGWTIGHHTIPNFLQNFCLSFEYCV